MRVRKIPVEVDAIQFTGDNFEEIVDWQNRLNGASEELFKKIGPRSPYGKDIIARVWDRLHLTWVGVKVNDWIVRGVQGEFYPVNSEVFWTTYETVNSPS